MKRAIYVLFMLAMLTLSNCALMDALSGIKRDAGGKVIAVGETPVDGFAGSLAILGPWGALAATAATAAVREYRHYRIVQSGAKDDDDDGKPDPSPPPAA